MALMILTSETGGAPTLNGVNGALTAVLRWALVQNGWAVEYGPTGNAAVFRAGTGNRHRLHVNHDSTVSGSAALATVRGCENASAATTLTDPFPTVAQVANNSANWAVSTAANSTARRYKIFLWPEFFFMFIEINSDGYFDPYFFGDVSGARSEDAYSTIVACRNNSSSSAAAANRYGYNHAVVSWFSSLTIGNTKQFWCRDITGTIKSSKGQLWGSSSFLGQSNPTYSVNAFAGYGSKLDREKVGANCYGENSASGIGATMQSRRGWLPGIWSGLHITYPGVTSGDTMSDTEYNASAVFMAINTYANFCVLIETSDTWSPPSG